MDAPVDLTNLREMTDNDAEMEKALFEEFFSSFEAGIATLQASAGEVTDAETWRAQAHGLKGIALNLGAMELGELCKKAQEEASSGMDAKSTMLQHICLEYAKVKTFLQGIL